MSAGPVAASGRKPPGYLMGQLHMHSNGSGDSQTPPAIAARWYEERGFDFIVFTDHNTVTDTEDSAGMLTIPGMELSQNLHTCTPAPPVGTPCLLHVTAAFIDPAIGRYRFARPPSLDRTELYARALDLTASWGGLAVLNHPNFARGADLEVVMALAKRGLRFIEIENRAADSMNEGEPGLPSTEALWDAALTRGARLYAVATDDAHHYDDAEATRGRGEVAYVGHRGWVMVRAERDAAAIRAALDRGDFYASTGLVLDEVSLDAKRLAARAIGVNATFEVIGPEGRVLHTYEGDTFAWEVPPATTGYLRLRARDRDGRRALCQPVFFGGG